MRTFLLLLILWLPLVAGDTAATEAAVNANPNDFRAWSTHAAALIQAAAGQTGESQAQTLRMALQCAQRGQELCIKNSNDPSIILHRGDDFSLGILGLAQMANGQNKEALDSMNKSLAAFTVKKNPTLSDMQAKSNLEAARDRLIQTMAADKVAAQTQQQEARALPVVVWRAAAMGSTKVAQFANPQATPMPVLAIHQRQGKDLKVVQLVLAPKEIKELGHMEGFPFVRGDVLTVRRLDAPSMTGVPVP